jgi:hypothetical protein
MPITPFHFGPPTVLKAIAPGYFSFVTFGLTQVLIDIEPIFYIANGEWPIHRFFHTYLGATIVALFIVFFCKKPGNMILVIWNSRLSESQRKWLYLDPNIPITASITGAFFGGYSHVFFDSIMHHDMKPFAPITEANVLLHVISVYHLHVVCLTLGVVGGLILLFRLIVNKKNAFKEKGSA